MKKSDYGTEYITCKAPKTLKRQARRAAEQDGRTLSSWVRKAISEKLKKA